MESLHKADHLRSIRTASTSFKAGIKTFVLSQPPVARVRRPRRATDAPSAAVTIGAAAAACIVSSCSVVACSTAIRANSASVRRFAARVAAALVPSLDRTVPARSRLPRGLPSSWCAAQPGLRPGAKLPPSPLPELLTAHPPPRLYYPVGRLSQNHTPGE
ncbi:unnamed protein product [Phytophthora fragariaefolia]|uniref:Unnamed protein product n=1 Tax=Phytophthora fragariaefolia TaxID=1490495 RepID=A0A9W6YLV8_9STRA|nr:unnamed protein product [Phytophthora fragariaefolia]